MPIQIQAPDGSTVEFPDGTDDATITGVMRREFGGPETQRAAPSAPSGISAATAAFRAQRDAPKNRGAEAFLPALQSMTFGTADEMMGGAFAAETALGNLGRRLTGEAPSYSASDAYRAATDFTRGQEAAVRSHAPVTSNLSGFAGLLAAPGAKAAGGLIASAPSMGQAVLRSGLLGASYSGAAGFGEGEGSVAERAPGAAKAAAFGGGMGAALGPMARTMQSAGNAVAASASKASLPALETAKRAAYDAVDAAGVRYAPKAIRRMLNDMRTALDNAGLDAELNAKAARMMDKLQARVIDKNGVPTKYAPTISELDKMRQLINLNVTRAGSDAEEMLGKLMTSQIDDFISTAGAKEVVSGAGQVAADVVTRARKLNTQFRKLEAVDDALEKARLRTGSTNSGGNIDNATRQNLRSVYEKSRNLTPAEKAAYERAIVGTRGQNALRWLGKMSPSGGGLMGLLNFGLAGGGMAAGHGALGMVPGITGVVSKTAADAITSMRVEELRKVIAEAGAPATAALTQAARQNPQIAKALARAGIMLEVSGGEQIGRANVPPPRPQGLLAR